jgi:hypothetical protein
MSVLALYYIRKQNNFTLNFVYNVLLFIQNKIKSHVWRVFLNFKFKIISELVRDKNSLTHSKVM